MYGICLQIQILTVWTTIYMWSCAAGATASNMNSTSSIEYLTCECNFMLILLDHLPSTVTFLQTTIHNSCFMDYWLLEFPVVSSPCTLCYDTHTFHPKNHTNKTWKCIFVWIWEKDNIFFSFNRNETKAYWIEVKRNPSHFLMLPESGFTSRWGLHEI